MSVYTFLILILPVPCMGEAVRQTLFTGSADVDVMFDQCLINSMAVRSKLDCARWCSRDPNCETFTFTKGSRTGTCRLHSHVMTSQSPRSSAPGSVAYTVKTEEERCPCGWEKFSASCYWLSTDKKTWDEAKASCEALEATLAEVESEPENEFLKTLGESVWLGGTDRETEGQWKWAGSNTLFSYSDWLAGEPSNAGGREHCVKRLMNSYSYRWNDVPCDAHYRFLCEKRL